MPFGPRPDPGSKRIIDKYVWRLTSLCIVLILACGGLILGVISYQHGNHTVYCVNHILSTRNEPTANDAAAHIAFAQAVSDFFTAPPGSAQQNQALQKLKAVSIKYPQVLSADQALRNAAPLGRC